MTTWLVRLEDDTATTVESSGGNPYDAAEEAVEHLYDHGAWAGEEMPSAVTVLVRERGAPVEEEIGIKVVIDWSPTFTGVLPR